jgi:hypothetical protein
MTKKEWSSIRIGTKVCHNTFTIHGKEIYFLGTVVRFNSNGSQVLVEFNDGTNNWYGRLGLELFIPTP